MRRLIAGMQLTLDGKVTGPDGYADWVEAWSDHYGIMAEVDACLLGGGMYSGYEQYWTAIRENPDQPLPMTGKLATPEEVEYARFTARTPHYVLSETSGAPRWQNTSVLRSTAEVSALKQAPGQAIYLVGGAKTVASLLNAGLVDELRLDVYPLLVGPGSALFAELAGRRPLALRSVRELSGGRVSLSYIVG